MGHRRRLVANAFIARIKRRRIVLKKGVPEQTCFQLLVEARPDQSGTRTAATPPESRRIIHFA